MKKIFRSLFLLAGASALLTGCNNEINDFATDEGTTTVTFNLSSAMPATRAEADEDGGAAKVNRWIMEVYNDGELYNRKENDAEEGVKTHSFSVTLVKGQTYDFLFWADTNGTYNTDALTNVKLLDSESEGYSANLDSRDAFSAVVEDFSTTSDTEESVELRRPFAQLNIIFTDLKELYETIGDDTEYMKFKPTDFVLKTKAPTSFNVLTQQAGDPRDLEIVASSDYLDNYDSHAEKATIFMDYLFASKNAKDIRDLDFSFTSNGTTISHKFTYIPFQRNYRTNILGNLMTAASDWDLVIKPEWDGAPEYDSQSFKEMVESAASGDTIRLFDDVPAPTSNVHLCFADNVTLDLGGHTITSGAIDTDGDYSTIAGTAYVFEGKGLKVKNGTFAGVADGPTGYSYGMYIGWGEPGSTSGVTVEDVTFTNGGINVFDATDVVIKNCDVTVPTDYYAVFASYAQSSGSASVTIDGGTYRAGKGGNVVCVGDPNASMTISGGTFTGGYNVLNGAKLKIQGGTFSADPSSYVNTENYQVTGAEGNWTVAAK